MSNPESPDLGQGYSRAVGVPTSEHGLDVILTVLCCRLEIMHFLVQASDITLKLLHLRLELLLHFRDRYGHEPGQISSVSLKP